MCSGGGGRYRNFVALQKLNCSPSQISKTKLPLGMFFNIEIIMGRAGVVYAKMTLSVSPIYLFIVTSLRKFGICSQRCMANILVWLGRPWSSLGVAGW